MVVEEEEEEDQDVVQHEEEPGNHKDKTKNDNITASIDFLVLWVGICLCL